MSTITINGKVAPTSPYELAINAKRRIVPPIINGLVPMSIINGVHRPPVPSGTELCLPFWHPLCSPSVFKSLDKNAHVCTKTGAIWTPGYTRFDVSDDKIVIPDHTALDLTSELTFICSINTPTPTKDNMVLMRKMSDIAAALTAAYGALFSGATGKVQLSLKTADQAWGTAVLSTGALSANTWYRLAFTYITGSAKLYINGSLDNTGAGYTGNINTNDFNLWLGLYNSINEYGFSGLYGEALLASEVFSAAEIAQDYQATKWRYQ